MTKVFHFYDHRNRGIDIVIGASVGAMRGTPDTLVSLEFEEHMPALGADTPIRDGVQLLLSLPQLQELQRKIAALKLEVADGSGNAGTLKV